MTSLKRAGRALRRWAGGSGRARAAERAGDYRDQQSLELLRGFVPEFRPDWGEDEPVHHSGDEAGAEDQLLLLGPRHICLQHLEDLGTNLIEAVAEPIPSARRIDPGARNDANHV